MVSFRLNLEKDEERVIWEYFNSHASNRSQLIKGLLLASIQAGERDKNNQDQTQTLLARQEELLQEICRRLVGRRELTEIMVLLQTINNRLSGVVAASEEERNQQMDAEEAELLEKIFEQNPIDLS